MISFDAMREAMISILKCWTIAVTKTGKWLSKLEWFRIIFKKLCFKWMRIVIMLDSNTHINYKLKENFKIYPNKHFLWMWSFRCSESFFPRNQESTMDSNAAFDKTSTGLIHSVMRISRASQQYKCAIQVLGAKSATRFLAAEHNRGR